MVKVLEGPDLLNQFDRTHLNDDSRNWLDDILRISANETEVRETILRILDCSRTSPDRLDFPEALLRVGVVEFSRGWIEEAGKHFYESYMFYPPQDHRRGVAAWLLGIVEWLRRENDSAYTHWQEALKAVFKIRDTYVEQGLKARSLPGSDPAARKQREDYFKERETWYNDLLFRMEKDLSNKVEQGYAWLRDPIFDPIPMSLSAAEFRNLFREKVGNNRYPSANLLLREVQKNAIFFSNNQETPVIFVECGWAAYEMGNLQLASDLLEMAVARFPPESHAQVASRWLLGTLQWQIPQKIENARRNWQICNEEFARLRDRADREARPDRRRWYELKQPVFRSALSDKIQDAYAETGEMDFRRWL